MKKKEITKRYLLFILSLFISAIGVAFTKKPELGVSPMSSVANILSLRFTAISMGNWLFCWNCLLVLGQLLLLRKRFQPIQLLQIPLSFLFGYFTDFGMWCVSFLPTGPYILQLIMVVIGVTLLAMGVTLAVIANVIMNSGEAFVKAISDTTHKEFSNIKIAFDVGCVVLSILLSLLLFKGTILGTREGTLIAAIGTGLLVKVFRPWLSKPLEKLMTR